MMRCPVIAANWKMNMTASETKGLARQLKTGLADYKDVEVVVCPPFTSLATAWAELKDTGIALGAQNLHWEEKGAFTGEISAPMLKDLGCSHVIIGHSERRHLFGETDTNINLKLKTALRHGLIPIFCIGETLEQREQNITEKVCSDQLLAGLAEIQSWELSKIIIAYEPVWAIGTGRTASPEDAQAVISFVRKTLGKIFSEAADEVRILYGGSVKPGNIKGLMEKPDIDGALVGGASLDGESFAGIVKFGGLE